jgi:predicted house-cleaning noncanonical NTP pyrophosphatase (MazG superfamily)
MGKFEHTETNLVIEQHAKLVRDKIPQIIRAEGRDPKVEVLDDVGYERALCAKVLEEATEFSEAVSDAHVLEEAADIVEVLRARLKLRGLSLDDVEQVRVRKNEQRGGFAERLFMYSVSGE